MKIVNRKTFLKLPDGTVYSKYSKSYGIGMIAVKQETRFDGPKAIDWLFTELNDFYFGITSKETEHKLDEMKKTGQEHPLNLNVTTRDGFFEQDQMFAIYDNADIDEMVHLLYSKPMG